MNMEKHSKTNLQCKANKRKREYDNKMKEDKFYVFGDESTSTGSQKRKGFH